MPDPVAPYDIETEPTPPRLPGEVVLRKDDEHLHAALGSDLFLHAGNCVRAFGDFHLALSGGSTPLPFYRRLMVDPAFRELPWKRTHLWIVDERRVPPDDDRCNFKHIAEYIAGQSGIPRANVHPVDALADDADRRYERELQQHLAWREKGHDRLDFVLLGMGSDGHTASLFPRSTALRESARLVAINAGPAVTPPDRVTMTYPLLNAARFIAVLVTGAGKRPTLARVAAALAPATAAPTPAPAANTPDDYQSLPILGIKPVGGVLRWYLDHAACP
ncbi:MAG: 6-phosphogluconolactonase [Phycisphaerales bacterium]|nr:6-phosphogluconolactonase [Phycisphaerales bacterium]